MPRRKIHLCPVCAKPVTRAPNTRVYGQRYHQACWPGLAAVEAARTVAGRPAAAPGRGRGSTQVVVRLSDHETALLDAWRVEVTRAEWLRRYGLRPALD